jgi:anti-sigma factor RsiW
MSTNPHPRAQLSAYVDEALTAAERSALDAHLDVCADCRARLNELRATATLIRALPDPMPTRRLAPRLVTVPVWLAPLRTLTTLASGISVFLFIASAVLAGLPSGASAIAPTSLQAPAAGGAAASSAERNSFGAAAGAPNASPAPAAADSAKALGPSPSDRVASQQTPNPQPPADARSDSSTQSEHTVPAAPQLGPSPLVWLALAVALGAIAFALQRRLRSF